MIQSIQKKMKRRKNEIKKTNSHSLGCLITEANYCHFIDGVSSLFAIFHSPNSYRKMFGEEKPINARNMIAEQIMMADLILENDRNFELCGNF